MSVLPAPAQLTITATDTAVAAAGGTSPSKRGGMSRGRGIASGLHRRQYSVSFSDRQRDASRTADGPTDPLDEMDSFDAAVQKNNALILDVSRKVDRLEKLMEQL